MVIEFSPKILLYILWLLCHGYYNDYLLVISVDPLYTLVMACSWLVHELICIWLVDECMS